MTNEQVRSLMASIIYAGHLADSRDPGKPAEKLKTALTEADNICRESGLFILEEEEQDAS